MKLIEHSRGADQQWNLGYEGGLVDDRVASWIRFFCSLKSKRSNSGDGGQFGRSDTRILNPKRLTALASFSSMYCVANQPGRRTPTSVEDYESLVGAEPVESILAKADKLRDLRIVNVNSTYYGSGIAEILSSLTLLMNSAGIRTASRVIQGRPDFFSVTKKIQNVLQDSEMNLSDLRQSVCEEVVFALSVSSGGMVFVPESTSEWRCCRRFAMISAWAQP
jgi:hypothetical protein